MLKEKDIDVRPEAPFMIAVAGGSASGILK
jgi:hypothetical protein